MILFCTEDSGPAESLSRIIKKVIPSENVVFSSNVSYKVFRRHNIETKILSKPYNDNAIKNLFTLYNIKFLVTGTSWGDALDKYFLRYATKNNVQSVSIIEHWTWYKERFVLDQNLVLPDFIIVNDDYAKKTGNK